jgi:hypothetical protein
VLRLTEGKYGLGRCPYLRQGLDLGGRLKG